MAKSLDARLEDAEQRVADAPRKDEISPEELAARIAERMSRWGAEKGLPAAERLARKRTDLEETHDPYRRRSLEYRIRLLELDVLEQQGGASPEVIYVGREHAHESFRWQRPISPLPTQEQAEEIIKTRDDFSRRDKSDAPLGELVPAIAGPGPHREPQERDPMRPFGRRVGRLDEYDKLAPYRDKPYFEPGAV